jgi:predicted polyphosphate/ATP-dependent NAD kinase
VSTGTGTGMSSGNRGTPHSPSEPISSHYSQSPLLHRNLQQASEDILREIERKDKERLCSVEAMLSHNRVMVLSSDAALEAMAAAIKVIMGIMAPGVATDVPKPVALPLP